MEISDLLSPPPPPPHLHVLSKTGNADNLTESTPLIQRPQRATANYSTEIYARNGQGQRIANSTNRWRVEQYHESVSEANLEEQLRSRDEQLAKWETSGLY